MRLDAKPKVSGANEVLFVFRHLYFCINENYPAVPTKKPSGENDVTTEKNLF
jgi:hypothetical protein